MRTKNKYVNKFLLIPTRIDNHWYWLCWVTYWYFLQDGEYTTTPIIMSFSRKAKEYCIGNIINNLKGVNNENKVNKYSR